MSGVGRNDACPCGSGRKFKKCCAANGVAFPAAVLQLAQAHVAAGRIQDGARLLDEILLKAPDHPETLHLAGHVADRMGNYALAVDRLTRAVAAMPGNAAIHNSLGIAHGQRGRSDDAIAAFRRAIALRPGYPQAINNLANALRSVGDLDEAEGLYRGLVEQGQASANIVCNLAMVLQSQRRAEEADELLEAILEADPHCVAAHDSRIMNALYLRNGGREAVLVAARNFGRQFESLVQGPMPAPANDPDPDRRLRVGYLSADFRRHSMAYFVEPLLARHDRASHEIYCYSTGATRDAVTRRFESLADHWVAARSMSDAALADRIRSDGIDVLVDLSGHSAGNRLLVFARKPAPIQATWIGCLGTTGLQSMDFLITDPIADPVDDESPQHVERVLRLPRSCLAYRPPETAPDVMPLPALARRSVTFASFNTPAKLNGEVIALWSHVLQTVAGSRLLLKGRGLDRGSLRDNLLEEFRASGIDRARIVLEDYDVDEANHLSRYGEVDIALDPFPHNGVTTTCGALWMGVPVVALRGERHSSRICASVLHSARLPEFVADSPAQYCRIALQWATNIDALAALRLGMRERLMASTLMDERGVTRDLEAALRQAWRQWCREPGKFSRRPLPGPD